MKISGHVRAFLLPILLTVFSVAWAGGTPLEAYSPETCMVWSLEGVLPEDQNRPQSALSGTEKLRKTLGKELQQARAQGSEPRLFMGQAFPRKKNQQPPPEQTHDVGCIRIQPYVGSGKEPRLQCHIATGDHIETYVFPELPPQKKNELASYGCTGECAGYPVVVVHEMPWEDGSASRRQKRASTEYAKRCSK